MSKFVRSIPRPASKGEFIDAHHSSLYLGQLWLSWEHHDVVFLCSDGEKVPAHKLILLSRSDYFKTMFANRAYSQENSVNFPYSSGCLKNILSFLYSGKMDIWLCNFRVILEIMDASRMMLMTFSRTVNEDICGVSHYAEDFIIDRVFRIPKDDYYSDDDDEFEGIGDDKVKEQLNTYVESKFDQVVEILNYSIANRFPTLMNASICYLKDEAFSGIRLFLHSEAFSGLSLSSLSELLSLDAFAHSSEVGIFRAVVSWLNSNQEHMDQKDSVLKLIHFDQMTVAELNSEVKPTGLLKDTELMNITESIISNWLGSKDGNGRKIVWLGSKMENGRKVKGRWGCMEKDSRVPMWIREMGGRNNCVGFCPFYSLGSKFKCDKHNFHKPLTEHGFLQEKSADEEFDDNDYVPEEDNAEESDSSTDEDELEEESGDRKIVTESHDDGNCLQKFEWREEESAVYKDPLESYQELEAYIRERDLL